MKKLVLLFCSALICLALTTAFAVTETEVPEGYVYVVADGLMAADNANGYQSVYYKLFDASSVFKDAAALGDTQASVCLFTQPNQLKLDGRFTVLRVGAKPYCKPTRAYAVLDSGRLIRLPFAAEDLGGYSMLHVALPDVCFDAYGFSAVTFVAYEGEEFTYADASKLAAFKNPLSGSGMLSY